MSLAPTHRLWLLSVGLLSLWLCVIAFGCEREAQTAQGLMGGAAQETQDPQDLSLPSDMSPQVDMSPQADMSPQVDMSPQGDMTLTPEPFELTLFDREPIYSYGEVNFQRALSRLELGGELGGGSFAEVRLELELHTTCFPFDWLSEPLPEGENWPPSCDAFDRNFELHLTPDNGPLDPSTGEPASFELMRAITPFGGPATHTLDLTDYANAYPQGSEAKVTITTWSDPAGQVSGSAGMWRVSAKLYVTPGEPPRQVRALLPLINRSLRVVDGPQELPFVVPEGVSATRLEYRATGHGGGSDPSDRCVGPAEEFCRRHHLLGVDAWELETVVPWRESCEAMCTLTTFERTNEAGEAQGFEYCAQNPTGDPRSVRAPRANWCPGQLTEPYVWDPPRFRVAGEHSFYIEIKDAHPEGQWRVSAHLYLFGE